MLAMRSGTVLVVAALALSLYSLVLVIGFAGAEPLFRFVPKMC